MNELMRMATADLAQYLSDKLLPLATDWWQKHVLNRLSFQQQRMVQERGYERLQQLDFAALLRVLDQNWYELSNTENLPREGRTWVKELQAVRNKWAHLSSEAIPASESYRDADTLGRLLGMIGAEVATVAAVETTKEEAVRTMAGTNLPTAKATTVQLDQTVQEANTEGTGAASATSLFKAGDLVALRSDAATIMPVIEVLPGGAERRYRVFQNGTKATYYESQLQALAAETDEYDVLNVEELHARLTSLQILSPSTANLFSLRSGRVQFVPYQYRPVIKLIRADRPRLLIADEVGVGKTIEAGLIIKELRARMDISSVLIICPKALVSERKWFLEMKRFDENFTALNGPQLRHCLQETHLEGEWPEQYARAIVPFSLFDSDLVFGRRGRGKKVDQGLLTLDPPPKFDLVIVDEAHHLRNSETYLHQGVRYFCDNAQAVLLLTATPVQLGSNDLFTLLNVLRPDLVIDHPSFEQMAAPNGFINAAVQSCRAAQPGWQHEARDYLNEVAQTEWGRLFIRESPAFQEVFDQLQESSDDDAKRIGLTRKLEELYTFSPLINRTRRRDIGEFTTRKPETLITEFTAEQKALHDDLLEVVAQILIRFHGQQNVKFMMTTLRRQAASCIYGLAPLLKNILSGKLDALALLEAGDTEEEMEFDFIDQIRADVEGLLARAENLSPEDPKVEAFTKVLIDKNKLDNNKVLVFSTFRHTLSYLEDHARRTGLRVALIHGDVPDETRASLRRRFGLPKEDAEAVDVLLSSEVGCEGLDFQFCDLLINYDLPWNPMRIEQRIGRIDRYGQKSESVVIVNLITPGTVDADIYERCLMRIGVFHHAVGGSEEILGTITQELRDIAERFDLNSEERAARLQQLADNGIRIVHEEQELESKQSELFGLDVPRHSWRDDVQAAETFWLSPKALQRAVRTYLTKRLASDSEHLLGEKPLKTLRLSQDARNTLLEDYKKLPRSTEPVARAWEKWLKGDAPTLPITFEQETATAHSRAVHLSVGHPLMRQAAQLLEITEPKFCSFVLQHHSLPSGTHHFALYRWAKQGIKADEQLVAVASEPLLEDTLFSLLEVAGNTSSPTYPDEGERELLDARHYRVWSSARNAHVAENQQLVEHRVQSLTVSHRARCSAVSDQIRRTTSDKIRIMRESELARANADFDRRIADLQKAAGSGDIRAIPVVFGTMTITERRS